MSYPSFDNEIAELKTALAAATTPAAVNNLRLVWLGRKGRINQVMTGLRTLPADQRGAAGQAANQLKREVRRLLDQAAGRRQPVASHRPIDITIPGEPIRTGHYHPISLVTRELTDIFTSLGFSIADGPEVEDEWHNFTALNIAEDHPARDMQDTFYIAKQASTEQTYVPRTHTSGVQIRSMTDGTLPIRIVVPGRAYRNEAEDATHSAVFNQLEGLMVDQTTSFANLKGILTAAIRQLLGAETKLRFRPGFFPYTEPSAEIDISSPHVRDGAWLEALGSGMVHPQVIRNAGHDPARYRGFAFGIGIERIAMLKYGINDLRGFYKPDFRVLEQF